MGERPGGYWATTGHGHVIPRRDGAKARCGGPSMCAFCRAEQGAMQAVHEQRQAAGRPTAPPSAAAERIAPLTLAMLDSITEAYCDANMKCDDDTGLYDAQPDCKAKKAAARAWLAVTGVGLLLTEIERLTAERAAAQARADGYALLVGELRTALMTYGSHINIGCHEVGSLRCVCGFASILAADPEARASELLAADLREAT